MGKDLLITCLLTVCLIFVQLRISAQTTSPYNAPSPDQTKPAPQPPDLSYGGDLATRSTLTGDWGGRRDALAKRGYIFNIGMTDIAQGNASGGVNVPNIYRNQASQDLEIFINTEKARWWRKGLFRILIEAREGKSVNGTQGSLFLVNMDSLYPRPFPLDVDTWALSAFSYTYLFSRQYNLTAGLIQTRPANEFASNEKTQFFSNKFNAAPPYGAIVPTVSFWGVVLGYNPARQVKLLFAVVARGEIGTPAHFGGLIHGPKSYFANITVDVAPGGHPGHQRLTVGYANRRRNILTPTTGLLLDDLLAPETTLNLTTAKFRNYDWLIAWDMDQYLYNIARNPHRGLGFFSKAVYTDGVVNPIKFFFNVGVGGKGVSQQRPYDSFGIGFYANQLSSELPVQIKPALTNEYGFEAYYNYAIYPWLHITPDGQWITRPTRRNAGSPFVPGVRVQITF